MDRPISCLIIIPSLMRAGAETQAVDLANGLAARGHTVHLSTFEPQLDQRSRLSKDVQFHHVPRKGKYDLSVISRLAAIIDREGVDILQGVLAFGTLAAWLGSIRSSRQPPVVAAIHTTIPRSKKESLYNGLVFRRILRRVPAVVFVCEHQRDHWIERYPELECISVVVHNGVRPECFRRADYSASANQLREDLGIPVDAVMFASIAAFRPEKGHRLLVEAFLRTPRNTMLVFAGDGELRAEIENLVFRTGLKDRTRFLGNIRDVRPLIAASQATVLASTAVETFSMAMLESMAMGVPMIAPRIGGLPEAIVHGETGLLFPIGDVPAMADCISLVAERPSEASKMGRLATLKVGEEFTLDRMIEGSERVLRDALRVEQDEHA